MRFRFAAVVCLSFSWFCFGQSQKVMPVGFNASSSTTDLVDGPEPNLESTGADSGQSAGGPYAQLFQPKYAPVDTYDVVALGGRVTRHPEAVEPFHWKGLLLQSFSFAMLQNATRIMTADQRDRHLLLNKPFWSNYWASLQQFNMHRWNDGDSIPVNYIGHPMQGAIAGYLEVQNDPSGRNQEISATREYWHSRFRAFLWNAAYSTQWEIGPLGEAAIFNSGGFTYPIRCNKHPGTPNYCESPNAVYTNNTGWVDFIITPVVGALWLMGEDTIDRYISDPLVRHNPNNFGWKVVRSSLNPPRSLANMLRGRYPWYRDYEHPSEYQSPVVIRFQHLMSEQPVEHVDLFPHYSAMGLLTNHSTCTNCRTTATGAGLTLGVRIRRYLDFVSDVSVYPDASPVSTLSVGGTLTTATFGVRSGYSTKRYAVKVGLAPGFATYSRTGEDPSSLKRNFNFAAEATASGEFRVNNHFGFRATATQMLIRFKSPVRDPEGIGTPPRLYFLSHDNYINTTNWGVQLGPIIRF